MAWPGWPHATVLEGELRRGRHLSSTRAFTRGTRARSRGRPAGNRGAGAGGLQSGCPGRGSARAPADIHVPPGITDSGRGSPKKEEGMTKDTATDIKPVSEKNLAAYDLAPTAWDRVLDRLREEWKMQAPPEMGGVPEPHTHWLATTRPDGGPHVVGIGAVWHEGRFYFTSGDGTAKSKQMAQNPHAE